MTAIVQTDMGKAALVGDLPIIGQVLPKPITEEQRNTLKVMNAKVTKAMEDYQHAYIAINEYVHYLRTSLGIPDNEHWKINKDVTAFEKIEGQPQGPENTNAELAQGTAEAVEPTKEEKIVIAGE